MALYDICNISGEIWIWNPVWNLVIELGALSAGGGSKQNRAGTREGIWGRKESDFIHIVFRYIPSTHVLFVIRFYKITEGKPAQALQAKARASEIIPKPLIRKSSSKTFLFLPP